MDKDFIVVIRSSNERTEKICRNIVHHQAPKKNVVILNLSPFKLALEECFRTSQKKHAKWLITVDADMLLLPGALDTLVDQAERMPCHYFQLQGRIIDNITGLVRKAGPRIYRTEFLNEALLISEKSEDRIRPEAFIISEMADKGFPSRYISTITCLHDYEQYYADLYRKAFVHAKKHTEFLSDIILRSADKMKNDSDFQVILRAVWDGLHSKNSVSIDSRLLSGEAEEAIKYLNLKEKETELADPVIDKIMDAVLDDYKDYLQPGMNIHDYPKPKLSPLEKAKNLLGKMGIAKGLLFGAGSVLIRFGKRLQKF